MGRRGPRPTPTAILKLRGSAKARRHGNQPEPEHGEPPADGLIFTAESEAEIKAIRQRLCDDLDRMNLLYRCDGAIIDRYARLMFRWRQAERQIDLYGEKYPVKDKEGNVKCFQRFPHTITAHELAGMLSRLEAELGLTPSSRSRINVEPRSSGQPIVASRRRA
jgi:P27 family predicted phage terminase small subunit